ncbi:MAG: hypothetical protein K9J25_13940 [Bacteroidales bacterium]|nr:hypothetical protein [Bacteroidales bacterium]
MKVKRPEINQYSLLKSTLLISACMFVSISLSGQESFGDFYDHSRSINNTGMYVLGSWAIVDVVMLPDGISIGLSIPIQ